MNAVSFQKSAVRVVQQPVTPVPKAGLKTEATDITAEIINLKIAEIGYAANATVIRTAGDMSKTLLDILI